MTAGIMFHSAMNYEQHVQQNNERLVCIRQALREPSSFVSAAKELLEWCLDPRAFQPPFEDSIISCLSTVNQVAKRDGFDLNLGCRLMSICANNRDKFSVQHSILLEQWTEDLSQAVLMRHQPETVANVRNSMDSAKLSHKQPSMTTAPQQDMMWPNGGSSLSIVTTVYSGTMSGFNAGPEYQQSYSSANAYNSSSSHYLHSVPSSSSAAHKPSVYTTMDNSYGVYNGTHQDYNNRCTSHDHHQQNHQLAVGDYRSAAPHAALNAAQVAAAAVATATATATAVALDQSQFQSYHGPHSQSPAYNSHQYNGPIGSVHNQYASAPRLLPPNSIGRPAVNTGPSSFLSSGARNHVPINGGIRYQSNSQRMLHASAVINPPQYVDGGTTNPIVQQVMNNRNNTYQQQNVIQRQNSLPQYYQKYPSATRPQYVCPTGNYVGQQHIDGCCKDYSQPVNVTRPVYQPRLYANNSNYSSTPSAICTGNPSSSLNVQIASPPRYSSVPLAAMSALSPVDVKPYVNNFECKQIEDIDEDECRLTVPVPNGVIMKPFRLEHNAIGTLTQHEFFLSEKVYNMLYHCDDYDLQLKCYHQDDRNAACTTWPANANVQICLNGSPIPLKNARKPLYIKSRCQMNQNFLQISVQECSCSHLFMLTLVERLWLLPKDVAKQKVKHHFQNGEIVSSDGKANNFEQATICVPLKCPISLQRMEIPCRGKTCQHIQCFDYRTFVNNYKTKSCWPCPICKEDLRKEGLEIDQYIKEILMQLKDRPIDDILLDFNGAWKLKIPDNINCVKIKDELDGTCVSAKKFKADPGFDHWAQTPIAYSAGSPLSSPLPYHQNNSPMPINQQRERNNSALGSALNFGTTLSRPTRQSIDSAMCQPKNNFNSNNCFPSTAQGHPKSVGSATSNESIVNPQQGDVAGSAPYTPASNLSSSSQNGGPNSIPNNNDCYNTDLYSDLDFLLNDSTTANSMSLLGDPMDEVDMLKYLGNSDDNKAAIFDAKCEGFSENLGKSLPMPKQSSQSTVANSCQPTVNSSRNHNGKNDNQPCISSDELSSLDDVFSYLD